MHALLISIGTDGDILPFAALGRTLRARGHRATLVASSRYAAIAAACGLEFVNLLDGAEWDRLLANPDFWHPLKCTLVLADMGVKHLERHYHLIRDLCGPDTQLVAAPGILPARILEERGVAPLVTVMLQPWMIESVDEPPVMPARLTLPRWAPRPVGALYYRAIDLAIRRIMGRHLNALRAKLRMGPVNRIFQWWMSPQNLIGMFPDWFAPPQPDWPKHLRLAGFSGFDGVAAAGVDVTALTAGAPIVFTFGTGMAHARDLFADCADACRLLGRPALFLTRRPGQLPSPLPPSVRHVPFAPLRELLPRCGAIVHHGGVGTTAAALSAGIPQLILPIAYDQFDNAARVQRLGAGVSLGPGRRRRAAPRIAAALGDLLRDDTRQRCLRSRQCTLADGDPLERAAQWIEQAHGCRRG